MPFDIDWQPCAEGQAASLDRGIPLRRRCDFSAASDTEKYQEFDRMCLKIGQLRIEFVVGAAQLSDQAVVILQNLADVLKEYPELDIRIEAFAGRREEGDEADLMKLSKRRAKVVREKLDALGAPCISAFEGRDGCLDNPIVIFVPSTKVMLLHDVQDRIELIFMRANFTFQPQTTALTPQGVHVADMVASALKESSRRVLITIARTSSELALSRANALKQGFWDRGVTSDIVVRKAEVSQEGCTVTLDDDTSPQGRIAAILQATPIMFSRDKVDVVSDCGPVLERIAAVLGEAALLIPNVCCRIEVHRGLGIVAGISSLRSDMWLGRAKEIAKRLQEYGSTVNIQCVAIDTDRSSSLPQVHITLVDQGDFEQIVIDTADDRGYVSSGCCV